MSSYNSWVSDFQAQGRYLFPMISMAGYLIYINKKLLNNLVIKTLLSLSYILSVYSFIMIGLYNIPKI